MDHFNFEAYSDSKTQITLSLIDFLNTGVSLHYQGVFFFGYGSIKNSMKTKTESRIEPGVHI